MRRIYRIGIVLAGCAVLLLIGRTLGGYVPRFTAAVHGLGPWGPIAFVAGYVVAAVLFVPVSLLTLAAGAIFGLVRGTGYVMIGAVIGASISFFVARYLARGAVERWLARSRRFQAIDRAVGDQGVRVVLLLRLSPAFPFFVLNYALGLTRVRFVEYFVGLAGMVPATAFYVYYGTVAGDLAAALSGRSSAGTAPRLLLLLLGAVATVAVSVVIARAANRALGEAAGEAAGEPVATPDGIDSNESSERAPIVGS
ncbi:MAG TPA: TVP38/TMEM64 family protein [Gemmatimonadaceae bacterium]|nr:TVP38/TMEM64 family protein [Gemmatimonadaceae bacterium]